MTEQQKIQMKDMQHTGTLPRRSKQRGHAMLEGALVVIPFFAFFLVTFVAFWSQTRNSERGMRVSLRDTR